MLLLHPTHFQAWQKGNPYYELTSRTSTCSECQAEIQPSGAAARTRRARKYSTLAAVVVRFSQARDHCERQGLLVTSDALARAEQECTDDAAQRAHRRQQDANRRLGADRELVIALRQAIRDRYPGCPAEEAHRIASHTALCGSGRIGRSAAGRALDPEAVDLAVVAWVRHQHTAYDTLLMQGSDRLSAREMIRPEILRVLSQWSER